ncbi:MAG: STAS domain-containing protein [Ilumatobacteraceae bacterium]
MSVSSTSLRLEVCADQSNVLIAAAGDLDAAASPELWECAQLAIESAPGHVIVDLSAIDFMDCAGVNVLVSIQAALAAPSRTLYLDHPSSKVRRVLELSGLGRRFFVLPPTPEAPRQRAS